MRKYNLCQGEKSTVICEDGVQSFSSGNEPLEYSVSLSNGEVQRDFYQRIGFLTEFECQAVQNIENILQATLAGLLEKKYISRLLEILEKNERLFPYLNEELRKLAIQLLHQKKNLFSNNHRFSQYINHIVEEYRVSPGKVSCLNKQHAKQASQENEKKLHDESVCTSGKRELYANDQLLSSLLYLCDKNGLAWSAWKKETGISKPTFRKIEKAQNERMSRSSLVNMIKPFPDQNEETFFQLLCHMDNKKAQQLISEFRRKKRHAKQSEVRATEELLAVIIRLCKKHGIHWNEWKEKLNSHHVSFKIKKCDRSYLHPDILDRIVSSFGISNKEFVDMIETMSSQDSELLNQELASEFGRGKNNQTKKLSSLGNTNIYEGESVENTLQFQFYIGSEIVSRGLSTAAAAYLMQVDRKYLNELLNGSLTNITASKLASLAAGLDLTVNALLSRVQQTSLSLCFSVNLKNSKFKKFEIPLIDRDQDKATKKKMGHIVLPFTRQEVDSMIVETLKKSEYENCSLVPVSESIKYLIAEFCNANDLSIEGLQKYISGHIIASVLEGTIKVVHISFLLRVAKIYGSDIKLLIEQAQTLKKKNALYVKHSVDHFKEKNPNSYFKYSGFLPMNNDGMFQNSWSCPAY